MNGSASSQYFLLLDLLLEEGVELVPSHVLLALASDGLDRVLDLIVIEVQFQHLRHFLEIVKGNPLFSVLLDQLERLPPSFLVVRMPLNRSKGTIASVSAVRKYSNPTHSPSSELAILTSAL